MHVPLLLEHKRDGGELAPNEIHALVAAFVRGEVPEAQMAALAMAIHFRGMTDAETAALTAALRDSGRIYRWPAGSPPKVDKHSTGGIGDKVSLLLAPLLACEGLWVPMVSGRGLGITGGTLDKLEAIPGFNVRLTEADAMRQIERLGVFMAGQTDDFCPADRKLYALRDVTGTVPSIPLIVASIMSKKLAESLDRLVLDVKFGAGAFMKTRVEAETLAAALTAAGEGNGVRTTARLTPMDEPLGRTVGNALEVTEAVAALQNRGPTDLVDLTLSLAAAVADRPPEALRRHLESGAAWEKFLRLTEAQGGDPRPLDDPATFHPAPVVAPLPAPRDGILRRLDARAVGLASVLLGAGRTVAADRIDFAVGFSALKKIGEPVARGEPLLFIHARDETGRTLAEQALERAVTIA